MLQIPDYTEYTALLKRVEEQGEEISLLKSLITGERWLTRAQAMSALNCKDNKLRQLTLDNSLTYRYKGRYPYYCAFSVRNYLLEQKVDGKEVENRILSARFAGNQAYE